jgi:spore coat protein CotH
MHRRSLLLLAVALPSSVVWGSTMGGVVEAATPSVVINELHFNPEDDNPVSEFFELFNTTGSAIDLNGWCVDGISYCFGPGAVIPANGYIVRNGLQYSGKLSNGGEQIVLSDAGGSVVDALEYDDKEQWPAYADGEGPSLQRRDPASASDHPGNWESGAPTPGTLNVSRANGLLPTFSEVEHTELPAAGATVEVTAQFDGATAATLYYRIGFGAEVAVAMSVSGSTVSASIPGQAAGSLIRYRLAATQDGRTGTWPRQGDGARYWGTTVERPVATNLPLFEFFMSDFDFAVMEKDLSLHGDDGYPMVFAYEGQVFDAAKIRVKGQVSRSFPKKKFKIILPPGYDLEDDDLFPDDVDEWAMHSAWADKSFLRETLSSEFMLDAGAKAQQAFPVRFERNGQFFGLYTYVEQPDGTYRGRYDLDDSEVYEVGPDNLFGLLAAADATRSESSLRARYDKETFEYLDDHRLREFIEAVNYLRGTSERDWFYDNVDIPSVVNILAASMVIQNQDYGHKNYRLVFDEYERVGILQNDYDLTWGRRWSSTYGATDSRVYVGGAFEHPGAPFFDRFYLDSDLAAMVQRRIRTLTDELLVPSRMQARVTELAASIRPEAVLDRAVWGTYGPSADPTDEADRIMRSFVEPQYDRLRGTLASQGRVASTPQPAIPSVVFQSVHYDGIEHIALENRSADTVDISGFELPEVDFVIPGGTVLLPGRAAIFVHEDVPTLKDQYRGFLVAGVFHESVTDAVDGITLLNRQGAVVARHNMVAPKQSTEFKGLANRSAMVSIVAVGTGSSGWLQVLACGETPGETSNLNSDGPGQTRATLALTRFDTDGTTCLNNWMATHMVADIQGYFAESSIEDVPDLRLLDSRGGQRPGAGALTVVSGGRPDSTGIVSIVATATTGRSYLSIVPCTSTAAPTTSNLNWSRPGTTIATAAFARFDAEGKVCVYTHEPTHLVVDLQGYLADTAFDDIADERLADSRSGERPGERSSTVIRGRPNSSAVLSLVAVQTAGSGFLQVHDCATPPGATSNLNYDRAGTVIAGLTVAHFDADGTACVYTSRASHLVVDLQGYFADGAFDDVVDVRVLDTRAD